MRHAVVILGLVLFVSAGCVQKRKHLSESERAQAGAIVMKQAPAPQHPLEIRFGNKIRLLGYDQSAPEAREGQTINVTWYWQVDAPLDDGWKLFTHLADAEKKSRVNLDALRPLREVYPEGTWKKGDFIKDVQEVAIPSDWHSPAAYLYVGFWKGDERLPVTGPNDGANRAEALRIPIVNAREPQPAHELPRLIARRVTHAPKIDGKLDEADWNATQPTTPFVQTMTGNAGAFAASARVLYDDQKLYLGYQVSDDYLKSTFKQRDDHLWEQDTVELMVDPDGDGKNYFEIQVAPTGQVFDTRYDSRRLPQPFGEIAWSSEASAKADVHGKVNDDGADMGYNVELAIPWSAFAKGPTPAAPPSAGATWRMNFFVMDTRRDGEGQRAVGWSPPLIGDFHTLDRFGRVVFPEAAAKPAAVPSTAAKPAAVPSTAAKPGATAPK